MKTKMTDSATGWRDVEAGLAADGFPAVMDLRTAAKALGVSYATMRNKVLDTGEIPALIERRGVSGRKYARVTRQTIAKRLSNHNN